MPKKNGQILALDRNFLKAESTIIRTFDQLKTLKKFDQVMKSDEILIKTFDQVKNDNFDQVKFDQVIVCRLFIQLEGLAKYYYSKKGRFR